MVRMSTTFTLSRPAGTRGRRAGVLQSGTRCQHDGQVPQRSRQPQRDVSGDQAAACPSDRFVSAGAQLARSSWRSGTFCLKGHAHRLCGNTPTRVISVSPRSPLQRDWPGASKPPNLPTSRTAAWRRSRQNPWRGSTCLPSHPRSGRRRLRAPARPRRSRRRCCRGQGP